MDNLVEHVGNWILQNPSWTDAILAIGIIIQGELTILLSVFLAINKNIGWDRFVIVTLGTLILGESFVFIVGKALRNTRFGWKLYRKNKGNKRIQTYTYYLKKNMGKLAIIAKFLPATNLAILLLMGWSRTKFREFLKVYIPAVVLWFASMTVVAYFFMSGLHYLRSTKILRNVEIGIVIVFILIFFGESILRKLLGKYASIEGKAEEIGNIIEEELEGEEKKSPRE